MRKIHCEEVLKEDFDKIPLKEVEEMIGFYIPIEEKGKTRWDVTLIEGGYLADSQFEAEVIAGIEEIKALLMKKVK